MKLSRRKYSLGILVTVVCIVVVLIALSASRSDAGSLSYPTVIVQRGNLTVSVTETGELEAARQKLVSNELRWPVIIRQLVPEGTLVKKGETIVEFECKELIDAIALKEIQVTQALNNFTQATQSLELKKKEVKNTVTKALQAVIDAEQDQERYLQGEFFIKQKERKQAISLAESNLKLAQEKLAFMNKANRDPDLSAPYSKNEVEAQKITVDRLQMDYDKAKSKLEMFEKYDHPRDVRKKITAIKDAKMALERAELENKNQVLIATSNEQAKQQTYKMQKDKLDEYRVDEKKLKVIAEKSGLVVYNTGRSRWEPQVRIAVGERINSRQQVLVIPEMATLQIKTKVYEAVIDQVREGITAHIRLDSQPDVKLTGKVSKVAPLPDSQHRWLNPGVKVFNVTVQFDAPPDRLKPGMTTQVELILAELIDVLSVPVGAIFTEQEKTFCFRYNGGKCERVDVKIGRMNDTRVQIVSGLEEDDEVLLTTPSQNDLDEDSSQSTSIEASAGG